MLKTLSFAVCFAVGTATSTVNAPQHNPTHAPTKTPTRAPTAAMPTSEAPTPAMWNFPADVSPMCKLQVDTLATNSEYYAEWVKVMEVFVWKCTNQTNNPNPPCALECDADTSNLGTICKNAVNGKIGTFQEVYVAERTDVACSSYSVNIHGVICLPPNCDNDADRNKIMLAQPCDMKKNCKIEGPNTENYTLTYVLIGSGVGLILIIAISCICYARHKGSTYKQEPLLGAGTV